MEPDPVVVVFVCWRLGQAASPGELQLPATHLAEAFDEFAGVLGGEFAGLVAELAEAGLKTAGGGEAVAVVFGTAGKQFAADAVELLLHLIVTGEVERLEVVDELHKPVEGLLMHAVGFAGSHTGEHFIAELRGLMTQLNDTLPDKTLDAGTDLAGGAFGSLVAGTAHLLLLGEADQFHAEGLGHGDLEKMHLEGKAGGELFTLGEGLGDLRIEAGGFVAGPGKWEL